jgi:class 3 adenylate cyclase
MTAARRLAAILAADVVGYSRLMGQDEAGTAKAVREGHEASTPIVVGTAAASSRRRATASSWSFPLWSPPSNAPSPSRS